MTTAEKQPPTAPGPSPRSAAVPLLGEVGETTPPEEDRHAPLSLVDRGKRRLLGLGKKKADAVPTSGAAPLSAPPPLSPPPVDGRPSPRGSPRIYPAGVSAASPGRRIHRASSPGFLVSPASSQIFERNVQESVSELDGSELSPHIPAHMQTEDHIPPVLDASSLAITDDQLNPDEVEIVMHSAHQPASAAVAGHRDSVYESGSTYASLDTTDVRRLSFISFADVVQAEHVESDRDAMQYVGLSPSTTQSASPGPLEQGADYVSQSHGAHSPPLSGELQIETMRQALRKTGSGDLGGARSQPLSAVSLEDSAAGQALFG